MTAISRHIKRLMAGVAAPLVWVSVALAVENPQTASPAPVTPLEIGFTGALVKMVGGLAGVLAILLLLYWLLRRFLPGQGMPLKNAQMRVLGRLGLGQRAQVALVRVGDKVLVLGVTPGSVTLLDKLEETHERDSEGEDIVATTGGFAQSLRRATEKESQ